MYSVIYFTGLFLISFVFWMNNHFGKVSIDQLYSIVIFNQQGVVTANLGFTISFIMWCVLIPLGLTFIINKFLSAKLKYISYILFPVAIAMVSYQFNFMNFITQHNVHTDFYSNNYKDPKNIKITAKNPKNLLLIYVESLETTYSDVNIFHKDLLYKLTHLNVNHISFSRYEEMPGTNWSIAGMIATQCALPLKFNGNVKDKISANKDAPVLPNAKCLSDILAENGYRNIYMNGSRINFSGVGAFLREHHYDELYGREKWQRSGILTKEQMTGWGLPDDMLLMLAKMRLSQLMQTHQHFNLSLFLIDTHGVSGQLNQTCAKAGYADFEGIVECTANQVADLVYYIKDKGWLDTMNIVIIGDHLAMKNLVSRKLETVKKRHIFGMIVSKDKLYKNTDEIVPFDMLPTMLSSLGFSYQGNQLGLGYSAIGLGNHEPQNRLSMLEDNILDESEIYNKLWESVD